MKRLISSIALALCLFMGIAEAQISTSCIPSTRQPWCFDGANIRPTRSTSQVLLNNGTATAPSWGWLADNDGTGTGFYRIGANQVGIALNGQAFVRMQDLGIALGLRGASTNAFALRETTSSSTAPTLIPNIASETTGLGGVTNEVSTIIAGAEATRVDGSTTAGQTRFMLYDVDNATIERVTVGAADSGGVGFKYLRIPN